MCGFTGYFLKNKIERDSKTILDMLALQKHRGPDDSGILGIDMSKNTLEELKNDQPYAFKSSPNLIFGFNRLSILDLSSAGHQPMIHKESNVALMMNGEIYNAFDFQDELIKKGFTFKGKSDTEVVLYLYLAYGVDGMLQRLNGMFAISIYDGRSKSFFLIRDRVGIKPLYVLKQEDRLSFSSEMKSFKALSNFKFELNEANISEFLLFRNTINNTLFKDIINITPGTYLKISNDFDITEHNYYDVRNEGLDIKTKTSKKELENTLRKSVKRQMISDVKLGCQLSGGVDSSLITAFSSDALPKGSLETISIVFDDDELHSEKKYMDQVAEKYNLKSHQFNLNASAYINLLEKAVWHFEQPLNHPNTIGIKLLSKEAKKYVTVLLSGEGADEVLAGYDRFLPESSKQLAKSFIKGIIKNKQKPLAFVKNWSNKDLKYILQTAFNSVESASQLYAGFSPAKAMKSRMDIWNSINDKSLKGKRKYEVLSYLPDLLMRQDKMSMAHTIENRVPFLDNDMLKIAFSFEEIDLVKKRNNKWQGKYLLKEICADTFDTDFAYRNKMGFGIPLKTFYKSNEFQLLWNDKVLPGLKRRGLFNYKPISQWMKKTDDLSPEKLNLIWLMVNFEIWASQYLD